ncbi:MAG: phospholipid carrier-dependent glycosyltransferase [Roseofilum sp. SBFL]|uniref:dolichyl-phosphate-mannose--protein mannosyltransferase n=1 Tax=unclassified Roseofilum TaxID=2620099 RepID=UPI001B211870|nr:MULTISPECIES: phospholipid carrier-dependent glycosyltransferase [unclassified Roseofilum]MBP0014001.1 phospholipid carrier-dependent glycosyltransferase [Roseofilum sp. SID3]MBP0024374.1 phospholipid carrier-dependent glycosyltransferase [Roseofilum sp. SID2]MBP0037810.1 phospholipid carrier-dependent glycosyltransferase [Roseofilum sp. SID1]MBP0044916.1 phospholipid carrier-dependent glycosyltransferase [Roseofilum sp. SBFL]
MLQFTPNTFRSRFPWFSCGLLLLWIIALGLRFWGLNRFNTLVFDEVYFAKFAQNYLDQTQLFDAHPPLGKYLIAVGMGLADRLSLGDSSVTNDLTGSLRSPLSYRWFNAFTGSLIPLVVAWLSYQLTQRKSYALLSAGLMTIEGLFLVESRYALINIYLVLFGLLGQGFGLWGLQTTPRWRTLGLILSGISFGLSAAVKWNGLGFWLGFWGVILVIKLWEKWENREGAIANLSWYDRATKLRLWTIPIYGLIVPYVTYALVWIPHLNLNPDYSFWQMQGEIIGYHNRIGGGEEVHPYCSSWFSWPFLIRPVAYYYQAVNDGQVIFDVHAFGNPLLWWSSTVAIALLSLCFLQRYSSPPLFNLSLYLGINYITNWLPWSIVSRCLFLYHYMGALIFAILALSVILERWLYHSRRKFRILAIGILGVMAIAFLFWLPIYLGLPLSPQGFRLRMWFNTWI